MAILLLFSISMNFYFVFLFEFDKMSDVQFRDKKRVGHQRIRNTVEKIIGLDDDSIQLHIIPDHDQSSTSTADQIDVKDMSNEELWSRIKAPPKPDGWERYGFRKIRHHFKCKGKPLVSLWLNGFA